MSLQFSLKKGIKLRSQLFFKKRTKKSKLSVNLVVLLFGFIYVYKYLNMCNWKLTWLGVHFSSKMFT